MKNFLFTIFLSFSALAAFASTPKSAVSNGIEIFADANYTKASYDSVSELFTFTTTDVIDLIQVFNDDGELIYSLPVMTNNVKLNKNMFGAGTYQLGFTINGHTELQTAKIRVKE